MNEAIKLAIEKGGYKASYSYFRDTCPMKEQNIKWWCTDENRQREVILDPLFWQALGKALGWKEYKCITCGEDFSKTDNQLHHHAWTKYLDSYIGYALQYHELNLTGGDTEKFWKELTSNK